MNTERPKCSKCGYPVGSADVAARCDEPTHSDCAEPITDGGFGDGVTPNAPEKEKKHEEEMSDIHKCGVVPKDQDIRQELQRMVNKAAKQIEKHLQTGQTRKNILPGDRVKVTDPKEGVSYGTCHCLWLDDMQNDIMVDARNDEGTLMCVPLRKVEQDDR